MTTPGDRFPERPPRLAVPLRRGVQKNLVISGPVVGDSVRRSSAIVRRSMSGPTRGRRRLHRRCRRSQNVFANEVEIVEVAVKESVPQLHDSADDGLEHRLAVSRGLSNRRYAALMDTFIPEFHQFLGEYGWVVAKFRYPKGYKASQLPFTLSLYLLPPAFDGLTAEAPLSKEKPTRKLLKPFE